MFVYSIDKFVAKYDGYTAQQGNIKKLINFYSSLSWFHCVIDLENLLKVLKITVLGLIVQVLLRYKVGATPELGPDFRKVYAAG